MPAARLRLSLARPFAVPRSALVAALTDMRCSHGLDSPNLEAIKNLWRVYEQDGHDAGVDAMLAISEEDAAFRFYATEGRLLHGADELRAFYREEAASGTSVRAAPYHYSEEGDLITVFGWVRVLREGGSLADAQVRWTYKFRNGKIATVEYGPLARMRRPASHAG
jgi:SnoaL-like protein